MLPIYFVCARQSLASYISFLFFFFLLYVVPCFIHSSFSYYISNICLINKLGVFCISSSGTHKQLKELLNFYFCVSDHNTRVPFIKNSLTQAPFASLMPKYQEDSVSEGKLSRGSWREREKKKDLCFCYFCYLCFYFPFPKGAGLQIPPLC